MKKTEDTCLMKITDMQAPVSHLKDSDLQKAPQALMRAAEKARLLAEQTGTKFVTRCLTANLSKQK
jgi:hypothetical protein